MAGFIVLWRVLGMTNWLSCAYCDQCDRPLRWSEYRSDRSFYGSNGMSEVTHYCLFCTAIGRKPYVLLGFSLWNVLGWFTFVFMSGMWTYYYFEAPPAGERTSPSDWLVGFLVCVSVSLFWFAIGLWQKFRYKPIYDRWVMQHGKDPANWPSPPMADLGW